MQRRVLIGFLVLCRQPGPRLGSRPLQEPGWLAQHGACLPGKCFSERAQAGTSVQLPPALLAPVS